MNKHIASVHENKKPYQCSICDKRFNRKQNMNTHIALVHKGKKILNRSMKKRKNLKVE